MTEIRELLDKEKHLCSCTSNSKLAEIRELLDKAEHLHSCAFHSESHSELDNIYVAALELQNEALGLDIEDGSADAEPLYQVLLIETKALINYIRKQHDTLDSGEDTTYQLSQRFSPFKTPSEIKEENRRLKEENKKLVDKVTRLEIWNMKTEDRMTAHSVAMAIALTAVWVLIIFVVILSTT